ncbi:MAG: pgk, phosphoglycerate kinase, phosphoglycerate kinase [Parcubacteria group bacterium]|nr:pgk, phosphoglycerate kinase, phosphoglycerate kinase [Parcubacteria group bacterium]
MDFKTLFEAQDLRGRRALVRVDWNVPLQQGEVREDYRIRQSLQTIEHLSKAGAKVVLISHLESKETDSLEAVYEHASTLLDLSFSKETVGDEVKKKIDSMKEGEVILLENLRKHAGEKDNDRNFAVALSELGDIYINEAFSASHREHASIIGIPKLLPGFAGLHFTEEVKRLSKAFYPKRPFLFILGGAKFDTKIPLIEKFITVADSIFVGGALTHNFFVELGQPIGDSLVSEGHFALKEKFASGKVVLPEDVLVKRGEESLGILPADMEKHDVIMDAGPKTLEALRTKIHDSQFILWNGPLGNYEKGYKEGTLALARMLAQSEREVIVGGADTLAAIKELGLFGKFSFISTGGGAMLDFLSKGSLPGIDALKKL